MLVISGPYCLVCGGHNVVKRQVWGVIAWTDAGPHYGWVWRDVCIDCEHAEKNNARSTTAQVE